MYLNKGENDGTAWKTERQTAVITGGATGMGRATALAFAQEGATVSIFDFNKEQGQKTVQIIADQGGQAGFFHCDVTKADDIDTAFDASGARFGACNVLFNHAGYLATRTKQWLSSTKL